jgi:hypothetical protein
MILGDAPLLYHSKNVSRVPLGPTSYLLELSLGSKNHFFPPRAAPRVDRNLSSLVERQDKYVSPFQKS